MATIRFYIQPDRDSIYEEHEVSFCPWPAGGGEDRPFYYLKLLQSQPSASYDWQQWPFYAPGQESYPTNFFCRSSGNICDTTPDASLWITQTTDLWDALAAEDCNRFAAGSWRVALYLANLGAIADTTYRMTFYVFRLRGGDQTELFHWTTENFINWDDPVLFDSPSQEAFAVEENDRLIVKGYIERVSGDDAIKINMGKPNGAEYYCYIEFPADETPEPLELATGWKIGNVEIRDKACTAELRSRSQHLQQSICKLYSQGCRAELGDDRCGVDLENSAGDYRHDGGVTSVDSGSPRSIFTDSSVPAYGGSDVFRYGTIVWSTPDSSGDFTGLNAGLEMEIKAYNPSTKVFELFQAMPYAINTGDEFTAYFGCDKSLATCKDRFDNIVNFRGEPHVPGPDLANIVPTTPIGWRPGIT